MWLLEELVVEAELWWLLLLLPLLLLLLLLLLPPSRVRVRLTSRVGVRDCA